MVRIKSVLLLAIFLLNTLALGRAQAAASPQAGDGQAAGFSALAMSQPPTAARAAILGAPAANLPLNRMILLLEPSAAQKQALLDKLAAQQNSSSSDYHRWLTASAFADAYSVSAVDAAAVSAWLQSQGFTVAPLPASRGWIEFSGTAQQVEQGFQATLAWASTPMGARVVLTSAISVPSSLAPLIHGLVSLDGILAAPAITTPQALAASVADLGAQSSLAHAVAATPKLLAAQLHLDALHASGATGAGQVIALAGRAHPAQSDFAAFRSSFGLQAGVLQWLGEESSAPASGDLAAATLTAAWAGVAAPGAQIASMAQNSTAATDGVDLALAALVDQAPAKAIVVGYSACEAALSESRQGLYAALYRQAAAEGITIVSATGDSGAAACQKAGSDTPVTTGLAVNALASTPWNTAVGAAGFAAGAAALSAWSPVNAADPAYASGGGASALYAQPDWQASSASGQGSAYRLLPDLALPTAMDTGSNPGLVFCLGSASDTACTPMLGGGSAAAAALFAGVSAVAAEKGGAQGNLAPRLYTASQSAGVFQDVAQGAAQLACDTATAGCSASGLIGYAAATGYDLTSGLGSVNAQALTAQLIAAPASTWPTTVTLTLSKSTLNPSGSLSFSAGITPASGNTLTGGSVDFCFASSANGGDCAVVLGSAGASVSSSYGSASLSSYVPSNSGITAGTYYVVAVYHDSKLGDSYSNVSTLMLVKGTTTLSLAASTTTPNVAASFTVTASVAVTANSGSAYPSGDVALTLNGVTYTQGLSSSNATSGSTTFTLTAPTYLASGYTISASYTGDDYYAGSSASKTITPKKLATTTSLTVSPTALVAGKSETLTATVAPAGTPDGSPAGITGDVYFYDGGVKIGSGSLTSSGGAYVATFTVLLSASSSHTLTAVYQGDTTWLSSSSAAYQLNATQLVSSLTLSSDYDSNNYVVPLGKALTLMARLVITPSSTTTTTTTTPSGSVIFYEEKTAGVMNPLVDTVLGSSGLTAVANASNVYYATLTLQTTSGGVWSGGLNYVYAVYAGDTGFSTSTSNVLPLKVQDFSLTLDPANSGTNIDIAKGASSTVYFVLSSLGTFSGGVKIVCTPPSEAVMTCPSVTVDNLASGGTQRIGFVVGTSISGQAALQDQKPLFGRAAGGVALAALAFFLLPCGRRARLFVNPGARRFFLLLLLLTALATAGIGCNKVTTVSSAGTPLGSVIVKLTASSPIDNPVVSRYAYFTVNVTN